MRKAITTLAFVVLSLCACDDETTAPATPRSGVWTGGPVQFFVAPGGTRLTATGSTLLDSNNGALSLQLGPVTCNPTLQRTLYGRSDAIINNNGFTMTTGDWSVTGTFTSATSANGTFTVTNGPECNLTGTWAATHAQ